MKVYPSSKKKILNLHLCLQRLAEQYSLPTHGSLDVNRQELVGNSGATLRAAQILLEEARISAGVRCFWLPIEPTLLEERVMGHHAWQ